MDSNSVVVIVALLCFFFFFFFFLLGGVGFYFFIVKKKDTSEEIFGTMSYLRNVASQPRITPVPLFPLKKSEPFDISEDKLFKDSNERLKSIETFLGSSYKNRNEAEFVGKYGRPENMDDFNNTRTVNLNQSRILELQDTVFGFQQEKELREKKVLEEKKVLKEQERIESEAKCLFDNLNKGQVYSENSMDKKMISLESPIDDAVLQELYKLDNSIHYKSCSDLFADKMKIFYFLEKYSSSNKESITQEMKYQYNVNKKLHGGL